MARCELDFPHKPEWCDDCWDRELQAKMVTETRRANDLWQQELTSLDQGEQPKPRWTPKPKYLPPPPPPPAPIVTGGMSVEPRRRITT